MSHFFSLIFNPSETLVPFEAGSYNSVQSLAMIFWTAGIITQGGGYIHHGIKAQCSSEVLM